MKYFLRAFILCTVTVLSVLLVSIHLADVAVAHAQQEKQNISVTSSEGAAMKSLRALLDAEVKFQTTTGKGEYGDLKELQGAGLIDNNLASGLKDGYRLTIVTKKSTMTTHPAVDLVARPSEYGKNGRRTFYLTEGGVMMTSEEKDAPLTSMHPFAKGGEGAKTVEAPQTEITAATEANEDLIAKDVAANEAALLATLGTIHSAEAKYIARAGAGAYGTLEQLEKAGLINKSTAAVTQQGYSIEVKIGAAKPESPATYSVSAVPQFYGMSGRKSFYVDQTGIIRGSDKDGGPADATDPPLN